jgi:hypothetical protein
MQQYTSKEYYFSIFRSWADQVFNTLSEAIEFANTDWKEGAERQFLEKRKHLRFELATLLTEGHGLFPNLHTPFPPAGASDTEKMRWFRNIRSGQAFDQGQISLDYSLQLAQGIENFFEVNRVRRVFR